MEQSAEQAEQQGSVSAGGNVEPTAGDGSLVQRNESQQQPGSFESDTGHDRHWVAGKAYAENDVIWYKGSYWRCEEGHAGDVGHVIGPPDISLHLWTPIHSSVEYLVDGELPHQPAFAFGNEVPLQSPLPQVYQSGSAIISTDSHEKDDSPDSQKTVTPRSRSWDANTGTAAQPNMPTIAESGTNSPIEPPRSVPLTGSYFAAKADEGVRYLALKHEKLKAAQTEELRAEIRGQRVWRLGGMGMWAYSESTLQEIEKEELWRTEGQECGREGWLESARKRTEYYSSSLGLRPLFQWRLHTPQSGPLPATALPIGYEGDGAPLFAARAWHEGGLHLGKAGPHLFRGAAISYAGAEITMDTYEVLCGPSREDGGGGTLLKWMMFRHGETCGVNGWQPVEGGREKNGEALFISKGDWERGQHPGKCRVGDDHAHVPWGGGEVWVRPFQVLAYAHAIRR